MSESSGPDHPDPASEPTPPGQTAPPSEPAAERTRTSEAAPAKREAAAARKLASAAPLPPWARARPRPAAAPRRRSLLPLGLSIAAVALLAVAAIVYFAFPHSSAGTRPGGLSANAKPTIPGPMPGAPTGSPQPGAPTGSPHPGAPSARPTAPPGAIAAQSTSGALRPSDSAQVKSWNSGDGGKALAEVTAQSGNVLMANSMRQYGEMRRYCQALNGAVQAARKAAPIPDDRMQAQYAATLTSFEQAAASCVSGITLVPDGVEDTVINLNQADLQAAVSALRTGSTSLYVATEALRKQ